MDKVVSKRTLRRQQKKMLIAEAQKDIETIEKQLKNPLLTPLYRKGLNNLLDLLYIHCQQLINSEV